MNCCYFFHEAFAWVIASLKEVLGSTSLSEAYTPFTCCAHADVRLAGTGSRTGAEAGAEAGAGAGAGAGAEVSVSANE